MRRLTNNKNRLLRTDVYDLYLKRMLDTRGIKPICRMISISPYRDVVVSECFVWSGSKEKSLFWMERFPDYEWPSPIIIQSPNQIVIKFNAIQ